MAVIVREYDRCEGSDAQFEGTVERNGDLLRVVIRVTASQLNGLLNQTIHAEFELSDVTYVETNLERADECSGIKQLSGRTVIDGYVHLETAVRDDCWVCDIAIPNGADFIAFDTEELGVLPTVGTRIRVTGEGLVVYVSNV